MGLQRFEPGHLLVLISRVQRIRPPGWSIVRKSRGACTRCATGSIPYPPPPGTSPRSVVFMACSFAQNVQALHLQRHVRELRCPPYFCTARFQTPVAPDSSRIGFVSAMHLYGPRRSLLSFSRIRPACTEHDAGIGHQLSELVASMATALQIPGATFAYQNASNWDGLASHGSLAWAEEFFR